jgi:SAM-dependent methyltransferase|tara:strand:+ start:25 stop:732 length:708 start_codon:yes stop_codon:yes gene_type:complete
MFWKKAREMYGHVTSQDDDIKRYLEISSEFLENGYEGLVGYIQDIGHLWIANKTQPGPVLEIGFGAGRHQLFYKGNKKDYFISEYSGLHVNSDAWKDIRGRGLRCDACRLPYHSNIFKTVISIYNLEHISDLEHVFQEIHRVLMLKGRLLIALPCEGGLLWNIGRELTTRRNFQKQYGINYDKVIAYEHVWDYGGVLEKLRISKLFKIEQYKMFPFCIPNHHFNLIACIECKAIN